MKDARLSKIDAAREGRARWALAKNGYVLRKKSGYAIVDSSTNVAVFGWDFDLDLDDVEKWLKD